jgi:cytoskeleton protein RodZ
LSETLGPKLKRAREASGVALRDIALSTKISVTALEALERNDFSRLPGGIFSRAFIRGYATAVGLDPEETVQEFLAEVNRSESEAARVATRPDVTPEDRAFLDRQKRAIRLLQIAGVLVLVAAGTGAAFAWMRWTKGAGGENDTTTEQRVAPTPPLAPPSVGSSPAQGTPPAASAAPPVTAPAQSPAAPPAKPPATPPPPAPPTAQPTPTKPPPAQTTGAPVIVPPEAPPPVPDPPKPVEPITLEFEVTSPSFVEIAADGKVSFSRAMEPGDRQRIQAQKELRVRVGDAGAFLWTLNGRKARSLGAAGTARTARVTQANFKRFLR